MTTPSPSDETLTPVVAEGEGTKTEDSSKGTGTSSNGNDSNETGDTVVGGEKKLSKNALKKLAKGKGKVKKEKKQWNQPGSGSGGKQKGKKEVEKKKEAFVFVNKTPKGEKKKMDDPMEAAYHPSAVEAAWQDWWEASGYYSYDAVRALSVPAEKKFVMVIPPPNVTGSLHLGHALTAAVEDTLTRWHRMRGHATLYVPGTDHAGIATQSVVEKRLLKEEGLTRHALGRAEFLRRVWQWKELYGGRITNQLRSLGSSVDWSRERFTMDERCSRAVVEAFVRFHEKGLLYRDRRIGNWSCALKSAISDIEVDSLELEGRTYLKVKTHPGNPHDKDGRYEFGVLTHFAYKVAPLSTNDDNDNDDEFLVVATTRLETMLGDTAVAVHPDDPRYQHLHGRYVVHPFVSDRQIPIITDATLVDMNFGTGAVKITPAHDPNDYQCGLRHNLEFITVLTPDGAINAQGGPQFQGMMRYDARIAVEKALTEMGLFRGKEPNKMRLALCSRSGDILEPMITPQWYVNCQGMAKRSTDAVRNGSLKIIPKDHEHTWFRWLDNIKDWCVSRQLWWGHQIPAWFATRRDEGDSVDKTDMAHNDRWIVARTEEEAMTKAMTLLHCTSAEDVRLERDEDVLDTWFSSGLFPFSVFGWPDNTDEFRAFYPTTLLETGLDILFFWVARMVMMGLELTDTLPFTSVYLHAMVRDKEGKKMSKSLGNVIDPLEVIHGCSLQSLLDKLDQGNLPPHEVARAKQVQSSDFPDGIPECGSDALRFGLLAYTVQGRDVNLDISRVVGYRQFCNKLWNATRFALQFLGDDFRPTPTLLQDLYGRLPAPVPLRNNNDSNTKNSQSVQSLSLAVRDRFMLARLVHCCERMETLWTEYRFGEAQMASYTYWLEDLCDVYLELIKPVVYDTSEPNQERRWLAQATLWTALECGLRILHPMMPFVTEELWQRLPGRGTLGPTESPTIMLCSYPRCHVELQEYQPDRISDHSSSLNASSNDDLFQSLQDAEAYMTVTMGVIKACRSLRSQYNIANKQLTDFYVLTTSQTVQEALTEQTQDVQTLGKAQSLTILLSNDNDNHETSPIPVGAGIVIVDEQTQLFMDLTGLVDYRAEIQKLTKDLEKKTLPTLRKLEAKMALPGYEANVTDELKQADTERLTALQKKATDIEEAIANFTQLAMTNPSDTTTK